MYSIPLGRVYRCGTVGYRELALYPNGWRTIRGFAIGAAIP